MSSNLKFIISKNICFKFFLLFYSISLLFPNLDDNIKLLTFTDGLSSNNMTEFMIDRSNRIWIGTYNGLSIYDGTGFYNFFNHDSISSKNINTFYNYENNVWFGTSDGIFNINLD